MRFIGYCDTISLSDTIVAAAATFVVVVVAIVVFIRDSFLLIFFRKDFFLYFLVHMKVDRMKRKVQAMAIE